MTMYVVQSHCADHMTMKMNINSILDRVGEQYELDLNLNNFVDCCVVFFYVP